MSSIKDYYENTNTWDEERLKQEINSIYADYRGGIIGYDQFVNLYNLLNTSIQHKKDIEKNNSYEEAYRRSMIF